MWNTCFVCPLPPRLQKYTTTKCHMTQSHIFTQLLMSSKLFASLWVLIHTQKWARSSGCNVMRFIHCQWVKFLHRYYSSCSYSQPGQGLNWVWGNVVEVQPAFRQVRLGHLRSHGNIGVIKSYNNNRMTIYVIHTDKILVDQLTSSLLPPFMM